MQGAIIADKRYQCAAIQREPINVFAAIHCHFCVCDRFTFTIAIVH